MIYFIFLIINHVLTAQVCFCFAKICKSHRIDTIMWSWLPSCSWSWGKRLSIISRIMSCIFVKPSTMIFLIISSTFAAVILSFFAIDLTVSHTWKLEFQTGSSIFRWLLKHPPSVLYQFSFIFSGTSPLSNISQWSISIIKMFSVEHLHYQNVHIGASQLSKCSHWSISIIKIIS